jgi:hypothetical protein
MKLMVLNAYTDGMMGNYRITPWQRLIPVENEAETIAAMRVVALEEIQRKLLPEIQGGALSDYQRETVQAAILRNLKIKLYPTNLKDYPETEEEVQSIIRRTLMMNWTPEPKPAPVPIVPIPKQDEFPEFVLEPGAR